MSAGQWPKTWKKYPYHRKANRDAWDSREAHRQTARNQKAQYNPYLYHTDQQIEAAELGCVNHGTLIAEWLHKKTFFLKTDHVVGCDKGEETSYLFAEWHACGDVHGRPISESELRRLGATLP